MNLSLYKNLSVGAFLLLSFGFAHQASAHNLTGSLTAAGGTVAQTGAGATDYYVVSCFSDPNLSGGQAAHHLFFQMNDITADANLVGMTVVKLSNAPLNAGAVTTVDAVGGDGAYSQARQINAGNGDYAVSIWHTGAATAQSYDSIIHCQTAAGGHTGTSSVRLSNQ